MAISFYEEEDDFGNSNDYEGSTITLTKNGSKKDGMVSSATSEFGGEIRCYIGAGMDSCRRISNSRGLLQQYNNVITEIKLFDTTQRQDEGDDAISEIRLFIFGVKNFKACSKLSIEKGYFMNTPIEIIHNNNDDLMEQSNTHSIKNL